MVLVGAVTRGAFEAGVLEILAERRIRVCRIVAASSGALNGTVFAAGIRARAESAAASRLSRAWMQHGGLAQILSPNLRAIASRRGFSDQKKLLALLRTHAPANRNPEPAPVELHLVVGALHGATARIGGAPATSYTNVQSFQDEDFDSPERIAAVHRAATASAAFPLLFAPVDLPGIGPCVDGGLVNNTPVLTALGPDHGAALDAIVVVAPTPALAWPPRKPYRGFELGSQVFDMLFSEWLFQDLRRAARVAERRGALARRRDLTPAQIAAATEVLEPEGRRPLPIISIRPLERLPGTLFSGFTSAAIRREYVALGIARACEVLDRLGWD